MFGSSASNKGGGSGGGRPIGGEDNDKEKWLLLGALGVVSLIGGLAFMEMGYKEIGWKEFVNRFVVAPFLIMIGMVLRARTYVTFSVI